MDGKAGPQSQAKEACIFLSMLTWHSPLKTEGGQVGGILYPTFEASFLASFIGELNRVVMLLVPTWKTKFYKYANYFLNIYFWNYNYIY